MCAHLHHPHNLARNWPDYSAPECRFSVLPSLDMYATVHNVQQTRIETNCAYPGCSGHADSINQLAFTIGISFFTR